MTEKIENQNSSIDLRTEPERIADLKIENLEMELANLQPGVQVILERLRPSWCKGQLEKITVSDEGLDLDYLIRTWGGHLISVKIVGPGNRIKGSHTVELYSFPPRVRERLLRAPNQPGNDDEAGISAFSAPVAPSQDLSMFKQFMELMNSQRQSEVDTLKTILMAQLSQQSSVAAQPVPTVTQKDPISELVKAAKYYRELEGLFGKSNPEVNPEEQFPQQIMDMAKMFFEGRNSEPRPQLVAPSGIVNQTAPPASVRSAPAPSLSGDTKITPIREPPANDKFDLPEKISSMTPDEAAETMILALGRMAPDKQDAAIESFMEKFKSTMPEFFDDTVDDDEAAER